MASKIISVVGAGGKTTLLHRLADRYVREGSRVLLTTTTHMMLEPDTDQSCDADTIGRRLREKSYCMAGAICGKDPQKIESLPADVLNHVIDQADVVLIEADGARHHMAKYPNDTEPVIPEKSTDIIIIMNKAAIGQPAEAAIFRYERIPADWGIEGQMPVARELLLRIMREAYARPLMENYPMAEITGLLAGDGEYERVEIL